MPLLLELNARQSVLHPDIGERCMLLDLSTEGKQWEKITLCWWLERDPPENQEEKAYFSPNLSLEHSREHSLEHSMHVCVLSCVWPFVTPMECCLPASSAHGILQARILKWVAIPPSRGSSQPRDWTGISCVSCSGRWVEPPGKPRTLYRWGLISCWVAKEKYLQSPILLPYSMKKGWHCSWPVITSVTCTMSQSETHIQRNHHIRIVCPTLWALQRSRTVILNGGSMWHIPLQVSDIQERNFKSYTQRT